MSDSRQRHREQAQRFWALDEETCDALMSSLERTGFLRRTQRGDYVLALAR